AERPFKLAAGDIGARMSVVRLRDGGLFLHSPVRLDPETQRVLDTLGPVRTVVAPSKVHHFFVGDYAPAYPEAVVYGAPGLAEKRRDLRFHHVLGDEAPAAWRGEIEQPRVPGAPYIHQGVFWDPGPRAVIPTGPGVNVAARAA